MDILAFLRQRAGDFRCPMCRRSLADCKMRELDHQGSHYTVEVTCRHCDLAFLVALELTNGVDVELDAAEDEDEVTASVSSRPRLPTITADDLLSVHNRLREFNGPLTALLEPPADD